MQSPSEQDFSYVVRFAQKLIQQKSLSGQEKPAVEVCIREAAKLGFNEAYSDKMGNFIGKIIVGDGKG
jgi:putative aminopeptidase FrvX